MRLTIQDSVNDKIFNIEIDDNGTVEDIKVLIEVETGITLQS